jgi:membrane protein required for colicin V production
MKLLMILDILFLVAVVLGAIKGLQRGFIIGIFSLIAIVVGLAAALKLSAIAAVYLEDSVNISSRWLPIVSFIGVFIVVVVVVRLVANILQKTVEFAFLGWLNRLGGALLYILLFSIVFSVLMFFAEQSHLIKEKTIADSKTYSWVEPIGPYIINGIGNVVPIFKDMFRQLQAFFENIFKPASI